MGNINNVGTIIVILALAGIVWYMMKRQKLAKEEEGEVETETEEVEVEAEKNEYDDEEDDDDDDEEDDDDDDDKEKKEDFSNESDGEIVDEEGFIEEKEE